MTIPQMIRPERRRIILNATESKQPSLRRRAQVVMCAGRGHNAPKTAQLIVCATSFVYKTLITSDCGRNTWRAATATETGGDL